MIYKIGVVCKDCGKEFFIDVPKWFIKKELVAQEIDKVYNDYEEGVLLDCWAAELKQNLGLDVHSPQKCDHDRSSKGKVTTPSNTSPADTDEVENTDSHKDSLLFTSTTSSDAQKCARCGHKKREHGYGTYLFPDSSWCEDCSCEKFEEGEGK